MHYVARSSFTSQHRSPHWAAASCLDNSASGATVGVGVVNVAMTVVAMFLVDRAGRRPLLLVGIAGMIVTLGVLGLSFRISNPSGQLAWIAVLCLMGYVASFAISLGPIFWLLIAEIYPLKIRGLARARRPRSTGHRT
jgi:MFS family permease